VVLLSAFVQFVNAAPVTSSSLLTTEEIKQLNRITETYQNTLTELGLNSRQNELNLLLDSRRQEQDRRVAALAQTDELIKLFRTNLETNKKADSVVDQLKKQAEFIYEQQTKIDGITVQITKLTEEVEVLSKKMTDASWAKEQDIQSLKDAIEERLKREGSTVRIVNVRGNTSCSPSESLTACMKQKENFLVRSYFEEQNIVPQIRASKLTGATMDLSGNVNYGINVEYTVPYSPTMNRNLNFELGIKSIALNLGSNVDASYFIDGNKVGEGKEIKIVGEYFGSRVIEARFSGQRQSSIEDVIDNGTYYYPFNVRK
jgi:hypothetical protein